MTSARDVTDRTRRPAAVVVGLGSIVGLQAARILAARGVRVVGVTGNRRHFAARTRACSLVVESDLESEALLDTLERLGPGLGGPAVLVPCTDGAVLQVSLGRERLAPWYRVPLPAHEVVHTLTDKAAFAEHARERGLPVPRSAVLRSRADAERAAAELRFPVVLKPGVKTRAWKAETGVKLVPVESRDGLLPAYDAVARWADALVAQEYVGGGDDRLHTCNAYVGADGTPLVTFVTRKRRQWPPQGGIASYAEECRNDDVLALTLELFAGLPFRGLGYVEVKRDPGGERYVVIETNVGRPTGRSATAEAGGVELLFTMYCDAAGLPLPERRRQQYGGAAWIDLRRDALAAARRWRRGELALGEWLREAARADAHAVLSLRDPLPFALELWQSAGRAAGRALRRADVRECRP